MEQDRLLIERLLYLKPALRKIPHKTKVINQDGSIVSVYANLIEIPDKFKFKNNKRIITIELYIPTLFFIDKGPFDEAIMMSSLQRGTADFVGILKAEGQNRKAYLNNDGSTAGQSKVARNAVDVLERELKSMKLLGNNINIRIVGYSEGGTQGASIAKEIIERNLASIEEFISITGCGIVGGENLCNANPLTFFWNSLKEANTFVKKYPRSNKELFVNESDGVLYVDPKKIITDTPVLKLKKDFILFPWRNIVSWTMHLILTKIRLANDVPWERFQAVATINHDYEYLAKKQIPMLIFIEGNFSSPPEQVINRIKSINKINSSNIIALHTFVKHWFANEYAYKLGQILEMAKKEAKF